MSRATALSLLGLVCALTTGPATASSPGPAGAAAPPRIAAGLAERASRDGAVPVIIELAVGTEAAGPGMPETGPDGPRRARARLAREQARIARVQARFVARLDAGRADGVNRPRQAGGAGAVAAPRAFRQIPFVAARVDAETLEALKGMPEVVSVQPDRVNHPVLQSSVPSIGGDLAHAAGWTGAGQVIAVLDTGVAGGSFMFSDRVVQTAAACFSGTADPTLPSLCNSAIPPCLAADGSPIPSSACGPNAAEFCGSPCTHGTHVTGIAVGDGPLSDGSRIRGVAPQAQVIPVQVFIRHDYDGNGTIDTIAYDSDILAALEYVLDQSEYYPIAAVNMSLGGGVAPEVCDAEAPAFKWAIDNLRAVGVATVIAAGNNGSSNGITFPGCISSAVSVAATADTTAKASFSNESAATTLAAPGAAITSAYFQTGLSTSSGTSMATPHVAGAMAVLTQKAALLGLTPEVDHLVAALRLTAQPMTGGRFALPRIRLDAALTRLDEGLPVSLVLDDVLTPAAVTTLSGALASVADVYAWGGRARQASAAALPSRVRFTPTITVPGNYRVWAFWPVRSGAGSAILATIEHAGGSAQLTLNQTQQGGRWVELGVYPFAAGTAGRLTLSDANGGRLVADAVRFDLVPTAALTQLVLSLPPAEVGTPYQVDLSAQGGISPYTWSVAPGSGLAALPPGLALDAASGAIAGTPTAAGVYVFTVVVNDLVGATAPLSHALEVIARAPLAMLVDFEDGTLGGWVPMQWGLVQVVVDADGNRVLRKLGGADPRGAALPLPAAMTDLEVVLFTRRSDYSGGSRTRYSVTDAAGDGFGADLLYQQRMLRLERRSGFYGWATGLSASVPGGWRRGQWYTLRMASRDGVVSLDLYVGRVDPASATPIASVRGVLATTQPFTQVNAQGGFPFDTDAVRVVGGQP